MKLPEIKSRVEFRMKPLLMKGVRVIYKKQEFTIAEYDYYDSDGKYYIYVSSQVDPLEFDLHGIKQFFSDIKRKDGVAIPAFDTDASAATPVLMSKTDATNTGTKKTEIAKQLNHIITPVTAEQPVQVKPTINKGKFVHIESMVKIYVTRDYSLFSILQGNRSLNKGKIKRIKDEIAAGTNLLQYCPVIVMEFEGRLKVIDGQHRLEVAKQIGSNVWYVVLSDAITLYEIAKMNSNTEKWTSKDFINCYAHTGNSNYTILKEFMETYKYPVSVSLQLLSSGLKVNESAGTEMTSNFQQGKFVVKKYDEAVSIAVNIERFACFEFYKSRPFIVAICKILSVGKVDIEDVATAIQTHIDRMEQHSSAKDYLTNIEAVVNIGKSKRRVIF